MCCALFQGSDQASSVNSTLKEADAYLVSYVPTRQGQNNDFMTPYNFFFYKPSSRRDIKSKSRLQPRRFNQDSISHLLTSSNMSDIEESLPLKVNATKYYGAAKEEESELDLSYVSSHIEDAVANHKGRHNVDSCITFLESI
jgi:hypothetical protein